MAVAEDAVSATEEEAERVGVKNEVEKGGDNELSELHSGFARDF